MSTGADHRPRRGRRRWFDLARASLALVAAAAVAGWGASFVGLHEYGLNSMAGFDWWTAWLIPATFDGAAFGATLITYRASIAGRHAVRGRLLMWAFTAISAWINWIHQLTPEARLVACGLPVAAVAVFDVVLAEMRADYEAKHGRRRFRLQPALLALRLMVDREGTSAAFREQITAISVAEIAGLGAQDTRQPADRDVTVAAWRALPQAPGVTPARHAVTAGVTPAEKPPAEAVPQAEPEPATPERDPIGVTPGSGAQHPVMHPAGTPAGADADQFEHTKPIPTSSQASTIAAELAGMSSDAERVRYAAAALGHTQAAGLVSWLRRYGYNVASENARTTLARMRRKAAAENAAENTVVRLDARSSRA